VLAMPARYDRAGVRSVHRSGLGVCFPL